MHELGEELESRAPHASWLPLSNIVDANVIKARQLRSETQAHLIRRGVSTIAKLIQRIAISPLLHVWRRQSTIAALSRLDAHSLEDIGIDRSQIKEAASKAAATPATSVRLGLIDSFRRSRARRTAIQELEGLSDRVLQDIGIPRGQIMLAVDHLLAAKNGTGAAKATGKATGVKHLAQTPPVHDLLRRAGKVKATLTGDLNRLPGFLNQERMESATIEDTREAGAA